VIGSATRERRSLRFGRSRYLEDRIRRLVERVEYFVELGARWIPCPHERWQLQSMRDVLLAIGEEWTAKLIVVLVDSGAASREHIDLLFGVPRMKNLGESMKTAWSG